ncbi:MAG: hypothetical protein Q7T04_00695 [Dehalococcoidia bacterium]|nr:hypothetical protein [Dehalococcoidia bacterium]
MDVSLIDKVATEVAEFIDKASDELAGVFAGDPKLVKRLERERFNQMNQTALEIMEQEMGADWVREWLEKMGRRPSDAGTI